MSGLSRPASPPPRLAVLVHPTGVSPANAEAREHWQATIETPVDFRSGAVAAALTDDDRRALERAHPDGRARFWGTYGRHGSIVRRLAPGDVVVLTGTGHVTGVGRAAFTTQNASLGDALWRNRPREGSYLHVYSLEPFAHAAAPLAGLRDAGVAWFQTPSYIDDHRAAAIIANYPDLIAPLLDYEPASEALLRAVQEYEDADDKVAADLSWVREIAIEVDTAGDATVSSRPATTLHRGENLLVHDYVSRLPRAARARRLLTAVGITDLDVWIGGRHELVEAKSSAARHHVRQALAQLLDYAAATASDPPDVLTALFPHRPDDSAVALLHRYGVDCVFRGRDGAYVRLPAPQEASAAIRRLILVKVPAHT